jgi:uncharacterized protein with HEPN domain
VQWATIRGLQTLTESATRLSPELRDRHPEIPWKDIAGFRNIVTHTYLGQLNVARVWEYIERDLPDLVSAAEAELQRIRS